jgi:hypothetical protein
MAHMGKFDASIDLEDAQTIIAAIKDTPEDMPIDFVIHTPGGLVLAAMQIARAVEARKAKVTVYVPAYAMSGGTLIALAANEIGCPLWANSGHHPICEYIVQRYPPTVGWLLVYWSFVSLIWVVVISRLASIRRERV